MYHITFVLMMHIASSPVFGAVVPILMKDNNAGLGSIPSMDGSILTDWTLTDNDLGKLDPLEHLQIPRRFLPIHADPKAAEQAGTGGITGGQGGNGGTGGVGGPAGLAGYGGTVFGVPGTIADSLGRVGYAGREGEIHYGAGGPAGVPGPSGQGGFGGIGGVGALGSIGVKVEGVLAQLTP